MTNITEESPSTLPDDRNLTIQLPHHQASLSQSSQISNEMDNYPETPPPTYDQALKYKPGFYQPFPPIPEHTNNAQTASMNCSVVREAPKPSSSICKCYLSSFIIIVIIITIIKIFVPSSV